VFNDLPKLAPSRTSRPAIQAVVQMLARTHDALDPSNVEQRLKIHQSVKRLTDSTTDIALALGTIIKTNLQWSVRQ
jgi:hypothetical protein